MDPALEFNAKEVASPSYCSSSDTNTSARRIPSVLPTPQSSAAPLMGAEQLLDQLITGLGLQGHVQIVPQPSDQTYDFNKEGFS
ncbi:hypothetical protein P9112_012560 [Eukaryota sp. TZLM1-RC]